MLLRKSIFIFSLFLAMTQLLTVNRASAEEYQFLFEWGSKGTEDGQFNFPAGMDVDSRGNVYVADCSNYRIQKFTKNGVFIRKWGSFGTENGQFSFPDAIAVDGLGNVFVVDSNNHRIQKFSSNGAFIKKWGSYGSGNGQFMSPDGIAIDRLGNVYVVDIFNYRIQKFTNNGRFITTWGSHGSGDGQFGYAQDIAIDSSGNVYVTDYENHCIHQFTTDGAFIRKWGSYGSGDGQLYAPTRIAVDNSGNIYVEDIGNHRIQKFTSTGVFITKWGSRGTDDGQFSDFLFGIAVNASGNVYMADTGNNRVEVFQPFGLAFPLQGYTPYTVPVSAVFDHSMTKPYTVKNAIVVAYTSETGNKSKNCDCYGNADSKPFKINGHYTGARSCGGSQYLCYDAHPGFDYPVKKKEVHAAAGGTVYWPQSFPGVRNAQTFNTLEIDHGNGYKTYYLHLSKRSIEDGQPVRTGDVLGISGDVGTPGAYHLHFEVQKNGIPVDPYGWQGKRTDPYKRAVNTNLWAQ